MFNNKMQDLGKNASVIRKLFEYGKIKKQEVGENNVFDFSLGNPSVPSPKIVNETLIKLINNTNPTKLHGYTSSAGDINVRNSIAEYLNNKYSLNETGKLIYLTVGAAASLTITFNAIINPGDEVIIFAPYFPEYKVFIEKANGKVKVVNSLNDTFLPDLNSLEKVINKNTKAVLINYPNNPTGVVVNEEIISKLADILNKKQQEFNHEIYLISDEPYRELVYNDLPYPFITKYYDNSVVCYSFSKSLSLPGERIGYILVSNKANDKEGLFQAISGAGRSLGFVCAPSLFQYMIPKCLGYTSSLEAYKTNRDLLVNSLTKIGYDVVKAEGAFYLFVKALETDANKFSNTAKKYNLLLVPSDSFGYPGYVRIAYCVDNSMIKSSLDAFKKLYDEYKKE